MTTPKEKKLLRQRRIARCEELILQGCTKPGDLATVLGVTKGTVNRYIKIIYERWQESGPLELETRRYRAVRRLEQVAFAALQGFARSQQNEEVVSTQKKKAVCPNCNGTGADGECEICDGAGEVVREVETRSIKGKAGDSSFLQVARQCFADISKLEGTAPKKDAQQNINVAIIDSESLNKYKNLPPEELLRLKKAHHQALSAPAVQPKEDDKSERIIDATVLPKKESK